MGVRGWDSFDVLEGVLVAMGVGTFPASVPTLHNAFYAVAQKKNFKPFVEEYLWQKRTGFFFSERLQTYLENMELAGLLSCVNPDFDAYEIRPKLTTTFDKHIKSNFSDTELKMLGEMARVFKSQILPDGATAAVA